MAGDLVRPKDLPPNPTINPNARIPADDGAKVYGPTLTEAVNQARPVASQAEAEAGVNASKAMTPLTTKQSVAYEVGRTIASKAQGDKADTAVQPADIGTAAAEDVGYFATAAQGALADTAVQPVRSITAGTGLTGGGDLSANRSLALSAGSIASLAKADSAVQSLIEGTGITVDSTDPQNPIISATGDAGGLWTDDAVVRWKADQRAARVYYGGLAQTGTVSDSASGGTTAAGRTFALDTVSRRIRQDGEVRTVSFTLAAIGGNGLVGVLKFKVLRKSGAVYTLVSESELITPSAVTTRQTVRLATPLTCRPGDVVAIWIKGFASNGPTLISVAATGEVVRYITGETVSGTWTDIANVGIDLQFEGIPPFVVSTGDSIIEGHNSASNWHSHYHNGPAGELTSDPMSQARARITSLEYQNFGEGSSTWTGVLAKAAAISAVGAKSVLVLCGVNDVAAARSWSAIQADMDAFKAALPAGTALFICEVLPWTAGNDTQAAAVRALNVNYAAWCSSNGAILVSTHDDMGVIRSSTGALDDLLPGFNYDGVHLTTVGVDELGGLIADGLRSVLWPA